MRDSYKGEIESGTAGETKERHDWCYGPRFTSKKNEGITLSFGTPLHYQACESEFAASTSTCCLVFVVSGPRQTVPILSPQVSSFHRASRRALTAVHK